MDECEFQQYLGRYHDGELDQRVHQQVKRHADTCPDCAAELASLRDLSVCIARAEPDGIEHAELARLHKTMDRLAEQQVPTMRLPPLVRLLGTLAASILIISGVWLMDTSPISPMRPSGAIPGRWTVASAPEWERVAITLRADPRPSLVDDSMFFPRYAAAVNWMLNSLDPVE